MARTASATLGLVLLAAASAAALDIGDPAPPLSVKKWVGGSPVTLESAKGKVLVVEFWATWCQPCRQTIPHMNRLHKRYADKGVIFAGITEEDEATVKKFMDTMAMDYHVGLDDGSKTNGAYMKQVPGIPHAFVVDRDGRVAWHGHPLARMAKVIEELVSGKFDAARAKKLAALQEKLAAAAQRGSTRRSTRSSARCPTTPTPTASSSPSCATRARPRRPGRCSTPWPRTARGTPTRSSRPPSC